MNIASNMLIKFIGIIFFTCFCHWGLINLYAYLCAPQGFWGFINTFRNMGSPVCNFINVIQFELSKHYITIWMTVGGMFVGYIISHLNLT